MNPVNGFTKVMFYRIAPERIIDAYKREVFEHIEILTDEEGFLRADLFEGFSDIDFPNYSHEECEGLCALFKQSALNRSTLPKEGRIFEPILSVVEQMLLFEGDQLYCRMEQMLEWRDVSFTLGQELFTTAAYAYYDLIRSTKRSTYGWKPILLPDRVELRSFLSQGLVENHAHLKGSSQSFAISFSLCMNHPSCFPVIEEMLKKNLSGNITHGPSDNVRTWSERLRLLAYLRVALFLRIHGNNMIIGQGILAAEQTDQYELEKLVDWVRILFGRTCDKNHEEEILDYALTEDLRSDFSHPYRLIIAERVLLYQCFYCVFSGEFTKNENWLFYLYLLLKINFRAEFIQINNKYGFFNFLQYERRKDQAFEDYPIYEKELYRAAILGAFASSVQGFEARITPGTTVEKDAKKISDVFKACNRDEKTEDEQLFFVFHFIKERDQKSGPFPYERHHFLRAKLWDQADALHQLFREYPLLRKHVIGIDAASSEIGCRPEVFSPVFSYLKRYTAFLRDSAGGPDGNNEIEDLHTTYHAGEDFYDIADGIRAIDEAIIYLHMRRGERIGHALAVSVDPEIHYRNKGYHIILPQQEMLDNDIWLLNIINEESIPVSSGIMQELTAEAERLLYEIYQGKVSDLTYYEKSRMLRGDPPEWYISGSFSHRSSFRYDLPCIDILEQQEEERLNPYRYDRNISEIHWRYHWDPEVRENGNRMIEKKINGAYLDLMNEIQNAMMNKMARRGIIIECNPSSNSAIGSFREYEYHPIFRILQRNAETQEDELIVTVNTDDIGVFDTSLENEYMLVAASLCKRKLKGLTKLDEMEILNKLRKNGYNACFRRSISKRMKE